MLQGQKLSHYQLLQIISQGGQKAVYKAIDMNTSLNVAVKIMRVDIAQNDYQQGLQHFRKTMASIISLDHPRILPILDFGEEAVRDEEAENIYIYTVMPLIPERSFDLWLSNYWLQQKNTAAQLVLTEVANFVSQAAEGLQYAHDKNIAHLDVKPANFLVRYKDNNTTFPNLALADFGTANFIESLQRNSNDHGTLHYLAPEQLNGEPVIASDQYALAAIVYELLTGQVPLPGGKRMQLNSRAILPPSKHNPHLSASINEVVLRGLAHKPEDRYPSVAIFAQYFQKATRRGERGENIYIMLGITKTEAFTGIEYPVTLTGNQQIEVKIPPNAQAGQVLHVANAGKPSPFGGPRGMLVVTLAIRPDPDENQRILEQLQRLSDGMHILENRPVSDPALTEQIQKLSRKVEQLDSDNDDMPIEHFTDIPRYIGRRIQPGLAIMGAILALIVILSSCCLFTNLSSSIVLNGNSNISAILNRDVQITALYRTQKHNIATATAIAQQTAIATQADQLQQAINAQTIPKSYGVPSSGNLVFGDLINKSNSGQWSNQPAASNSNACYFGSSDNFYHATMSIASSTPNSCQTSGDVGNVNTGATFVLQVQMAINNGDEGGFAFDVTDKGYYYVYIKQSGDYEIGSNNTPFSTGKGHSQALIAGVGPDKLNLIAVVANQGNLTFYANLQKIFTISGINYGNQGNLAVLAKSDGSPTDVMYQNIKVWQY